MNLKNGPKDEAKGTMQTKVCTTLLQTHIGKKTGTSAWSRKPVNSRFVAILRQSSRKPILRTSRKNRSTHPNAPPSLLLLLLIVGSWRVCRRDGWSDFRAAMCQDSTFCTWQFGLLWYFTVICGFCVSVLACKSAASSLDLLCLCFLASVQGWGGGMGGVITSMRMRLASSVSLFAPRRTSMCMRLTFKVFLCFCAGVGREGEGWGPCRCGLRLVFPLFA